MHDHPRLARTGTGQDQGVLVGGRRDDRLLFRMLQIVDDPLVRFDGDRPVEHFQAVAKVLVQEIGPRLAEVRQHQLQPVLDRLDAAAGVLVHHVDLQDPLLVVRFQRREVSFGVAAALGFGQQADRHGLAEDRQAVLQDDRTLLVQIHQAAVHGGQHVFDLSPQGQVGFHGAGQVLAAEFHQQIGRRLGACRNLGQDGLQHDRRHVAAFLRNLPHRLPIALELDAIVVALAVPELQAGSAGGKTPAVHAQAGQQPPDQLRTGRQPLIDQRLVQPPQRHGQPAVLLRVRRLLLHHLQQGRFHGGGVPQPVLRAVVNLVAHIGRQLQALTHQSGSRHLVQRPQHALRLAGRIAFGRRLHAPRVA